MVTVSVENGLTCDEEMPISNTCFVGPDSEVYGPGVHGPLVGFRVERRTAVVPQPRVVEVHRFLSMVKHWLLDKQRVNS